MTIVWVIIFIVSMFVLVKGADLLLDSAEKIGLDLKLSPFIIGVTIVGIGTSLPELVAGIAAVLKHATEIVPADVVGSNITNILLVIGLSAVFSKGLKVTTDLIDLDLPLLALSTLLFLGMAWDGIITKGESLILLLTCIIYLIYNFTHKDETPEKEYIPRVKFSSHDLMYFALGIIGISVGAKYTVESMLFLSHSLAIGVGLISLVALSLGTSLPELVVAVKAARKGKSELAIGHIFGSNIFNILGVTAIPGLMSNLVLDERTHSFGLPVLAATTFIFIISGISKRIHSWEGAMYLMIYIFFIGKVFGII